LVAPGNLVIAAASTKADAAAPTWNLLATLFAPLLVEPTGIASTYRETQMLMSGTSIAAPVVAGAAAVLLQANPGLTPPLIKAILQYTAQPIPGANLLQQGAGQLNLTGAVALAKVLRTDIASLSTSFMINTGDPLLAAGKVLPARSTTIGGVKFNWSRIAFVGGNRVVSGDALFTKYQAIYNPSLVWSNQGLVHRDNTLWAEGGAVHPATLWEHPIPTYSILSPDVVDATHLLGTSSKIGSTGLFTPTATASGWLIAGSGKTLGQGLVISEGVVMSEGIVMSEGLVLSEGVVMSEGIVMSEGLVLSEGVVMSEGRMAGEK
jgi:serine protease AprX